MSEYIENFQGRVDDIVASPHPEDAHVSEFELRLEFLELLATGKVTDLLEIQELSKILMKTNDIHRWFA